MYSAKNDVYSSEQMSFSVSFLSFLCWVIVTWLCITLLYHCNGGFSLVDVFCFSQDIVLKKTNVPSLLKD